MKKAITILLMAVLLLSMVACSNENGTMENGSGSKELDLEAVTEALTGKSGDIWIWHDDEMGIIYNFDSSGKVTQGSMIGNARIPDVKGTFEVKEYEIILTNDSGSSEKVLTYTYDDEVLCLFDGDKEFEFSKE